MDLTTTLFLATDGLTNGAVYTLVGLSLVLVYTTTRVVNIAQGEYVTFGALTLASFVEGTLAPVVYVVAAGGAACLLLDLLRARANGRSLLRPLASYLAAGAALAALAALAWRVPSPLLQMLASLALVAALGPIVYRLTVEPNPANSTVVLVIIGVGVSMIMHPLALLLGRRSARRAAHQRGAPGTGRRRHRGAVAVHHGLLAGGRPGAIPVLPLHPDRQALRAARSTGKARSTAASPW